MGSRGRVTSMRRLVIGFALTTGQAWAASGTPAEAPGAEAPPATTAASRPEAPRKWLREPLTDEELAALEKKIEQDPSNLELRATALQHYLKMFASRDPEKWRGRAPHVLWLIAHAPDSDLAGRAEAQAVPMLEPDLFVEAEALWRRQVQAHPRNARVLGNAAAFLLLSDKKTALDLYAAAAAIEPTNPEWSRRLARAQSLKARTSRDDPDAPRLALENFERAFEQETSDIKRTSLLRDLAESALTAENDEKAERYAKELLEKLKDRPPELSDDYGVHDGHRVLGHVALRRGDVASAKSHLLAAGAVSGAPVLNSFGPELTLAKDLLAKGESETVIEYLTSIRRFWAGREKAIDGWIASIRAGQTPELDRWSAVLR